ncbi:MAG: DPP IV N-terminal domain-containing protein [Chloroflexota bacterium]|nr:DPP IV N-terminal domain-containing protein [Chloroflexota bacterium]
MRVPPALVAVIASAVTACGAPPVTPVPSDGGGTATIAPSWSPSPDARPASIDAADRPAPEDDPVDAPLTDGTLVFDACPEGDLCGIEVMDLATGVRRDLVDVGPGNLAFGPDLSPDGGTVLYRCRVRNEFDDVCSADLATGETTNVTNTGVDYSHAWSPDGARIAFASGRDPAGGLANDIYVMEADGGGIERITEQVGVDEYPSWSPDGSSIAFQCNLGRLRAGRQGDFDICIVPSRGGPEPVRVTDFEEGRCISPEYSPVRELIAFTCETGDEIEWDAAMYLLDVETGTVRALTTDKAYDPRWSPDGALIYFNRGNRLWVMRSDGSGEAELPRPAVDVDGGFDIGWPVAGA